MDAAQPSLLTRFTIFIDDLKRGIGIASAPPRAPVRLPAPYPRLFNNRLARLAQRFRDLLARIAAEQASGQPRNIAKPRTRRPAKPTPEPTTPPEPTPALPTGFGWIVKRFPGDLGIHATRFRILFCDAEMEALIASDPRFGRILRPICHLLGINLRTIYRSVRAPKEYPTPADPNTPNPWIFRRHPLILERPRRTNSPGNPNARKPPRATSSRVRLQPPPLPPPPRLPTPDEQKRAFREMFGTYQESGRMQDFSPIDWIYVHPRE